MEEVENLSLKMQLMIKSEKLLLEVRRHIDKLRLIFKLVVLMEKEIAHQGLTELHVVASMHARKTMMAALSEGFIAMPGGYGTLEEIIEIITWGQLRFHDKPCGLLNVDGFFDHLLAYLDHSNAEGFLRRENRDMLLVDRDPVGLVQQFERYAAPHVEKWTA